MPRHELWPAPPDRWPNPLDVLDGHIERDDEAVDPQTRLTAVSLARSLIRSYPAPKALTEEGPA